MELIVNTCCRFLNDNFSLRVSTRESCDIEEDCVDFQHCLPFLQRLNMLARVDTRIRDVPLEEN